MQHNKIYNYVKNYMAMKKKTWQTLMKNVKYVIL